MAHRSSGAARGAASALLMAAVVLCAAGAAAAQVELPTNVLAGRVRSSNEAEAAVATQLLKAFGSVSREMTTGVQEDIVFAASAPENAASVDLNKVASRVFAAAIAGWQLGVRDAPSNKGLAPKKFLFYDRYHYYQIPAKPIATLVMFHGCVHDASGSWPYDPVGCPECLGLPEEVAHVKQALAYGFAVLAVESRNRTQHGRCFSSSKDPMVSDQWEAPYVIQNFLYEHALQYKPLYTLGISAGAAFAVKIPKTFYNDNFEIKVAGVISEVNAIPWYEWGLLDANGVMKYENFPPHVYIAMENDPSTNLLIDECVQGLRNHSVNAASLMVKERAVTHTWFSDRSPVISARQSKEIVDALIELKLLDKAGFLRADPRLGLEVKGGPLYQWNRRLVEKLPWLHMSGRMEPMLSVLSDRSSIYEEMNAAYARHEGIADFVVPSLFYLQSNGTLDLAQLAASLAVTKLRDLTMTRIYTKPPPPSRPAAAGKKPRRRQLRPRRG